VFSGGFLGLDNIGVFDRSSALPTGGYLEQSDGTAWMAFFASLMLQIAVELAMEDEHYEAMALKYFEHFLWIASSMDEHWRDHVLFYEYFHGETGAGIGASHQTGWTGVIAFLIQGFKAVEAEKVLEKGMAAVTEVSAEVAKETDKPEAAQVAEEVHEEVAEKVVAQVLETVQQQVTEAVQDQGADAAKLQEKVQEIVMEKVAKAVQKKSEEVQKQTEQGTEEKKDVL